MSDRYNRPRTPPSPPPSSSSRKTSSRGPAASASTSKSISSKSYGDHAYEKYDKAYKSSTTYQSSSSSSSKQYSDDKYKSSSKLSEKVTSSKYVSKSVNYDDNFKLGAESQYSSQRYGDKDAGSSKFSEKGRYGTDKYPMSANTSASQYNNKKYDDYATYTDKSGRYLKQDAGSYYGSSYDTYGSYEGYGSDRQRSNAYGSDRLSVGASSYGGDKYGGGSNRLGGGYTGNSGYASNKTNRNGGNMGYGGDKYGRGGGYAGDKLGGSTLGYGDTKSAGTARSGLYADDDRRPYRSYSPSRTARSPLRSYSGSYDDYGYASSSRSTEKQYLDRYVIGDSVVYGPPGQYPRNLTHTSSSPSRRPPSPPSPPMMLSRGGYNKYSATSPRRYSSGRRSVSPTSSSYHALSSTSRRPPSPPSKRPPSPDSVYMRGRDRSYDTTRSKERYGSRASDSRSPLRDNRGMTDRRDGDRTRIDDRNRRDDDRRVGSREKSSTLDTNKRGRMGDQRNSSYRSSGDLRTYPKDSYTGSTQNHKDDRNQLSPNRNARRDSRNDSRDRGRRLEDRLGINPTSGTRRSPVNRPRMGRNAASPRDGNNKKPRRPDDLRLWIESRKNDVGKKGMSQSRGRPAGKGMARSGGDRSKMLKRSRLGDPKRRLGGKAKKSGGGPMRRNKILNKYRRLTARRGMRSGGGGGRDGGGGGGRNNNRSNRDAKGGRKGDGGDMDNDNNEDSTKPGSTASIRRVIKKPKRVSQVNNLEIKPRIMGKPVKKLLKDPKEDHEDSGKSRPSQDQQTSHHSSREASSREEEKLAPLRNESGEGGGSGTSDLKTR